MIDVPKSTAFVTKRGFSITPHLLSDHFIQSHSSPRPQAHEPGEHTMMQTASYFAPPLSSSPHQPSTESLRESVAQLLSRAHNLPCSKASQAFAQLVQPISRFQLALDALLPLLDDHVEVTPKPHILKPHTVY